MFEFNPAKIRLKYATYKYYCILTTPSSHTIIPPSHHLEQLDQPETPCPFTAAKSCTGLDQLDAGLRTIPAAHPESIPSW